jgi:hypothetical protein
MQHEAKMSTKNVDKWDKPEARPPIPPYERPEALIYQAKEPPVAAAAARNASRERGRVDAWDAKIFIKAGDTRNRHPLT